jgi:hypothetical protein
MMITDEKFDFWVKNKLNVLFIGEHGIGKTAQVVEAFNRNKLKWLYYSVPTMDPWVDMVGIPKEVEGEDGTKYLDLIRPKAFQYDEVEALFFDEFNRDVGGKVRNAVMELIQFKSINGKKFNNLKVVWAAINPEDDEKTYDVERLDPAQKDRFQVHVHLDYAPETKYFTSKYGKATSKSAIEWWRGLTEECKKMVSPRRLDYALEMYGLGGDMRDVLPEKAGVSKLSALLTNGLAKDKIIALTKTEKWSEIEEMFKNDNVYSEVETWVLENKDRRQMYIPLWPNERISKVISDNGKNSKTLSSVISNYFTSTKIKDVVDAINKTTNDAQLKIAIRDAIPLLKSDSYSSAMIDTWVPTVATNPDYTKSLQSCYSNKNGEITATSKEIIDICLAIPADSVISNAKTVHTLLTTIIAKSAKDSIVSMKDTIFGVYNHCLKKCGINVSSEEYKIANNVIIQKEVESYVWTPKKSS